MATARMTTPLLATARMTTPLPSYIFYQLPGGRKGRNPERDRCLKCGCPYPTNPHNNSFYCPNPSCRLPHVCLRRDCRPFASCLPDPTARSTTCYNCKQIIAIERIPPEAMAANRPNECPPSFRCPNCLFLHYYYRHFFIDIDAAEVRSPVPPITTTATPTVDHDFMEEDDEEEDTDDESCPICRDSLFMNEFSRVYYLQPCGHGFHKDCILQWLNAGNKTTCPLCRQECFQYVPRVCYDGVSLVDEFELHLVVKEVVMSGSTNDHSCDGKIIGFDDDGDTIMVDIAS